MEDRDKVDGVETVDIETLGNDPDAFAAHGIARLKVQRGDKLRIVAVRIKSMPQDELDDIRRRAPKPPSKMFTDPSTKQKVMIPDLTDAAYLEKAEQYQREFTKQVVGRGVDVKLTLQDGRTATTPEEKFEALQQRGLTGPQFTDLTNAILGLTQFSDEEREKFL